MDLMVVVSLLKQSSKVDSFSFCITVASLLLLIIVILLFADNYIMIILSVLIFVLGIIEKYFAIRVDFDRLLFNALQTYSDSDLKIALKSMDQSLYQFGLIKKGYDPECSLLNRINGAIYLFKKQLLCYVIQTVLFICIVIVMMIC